MPNQAIVIKKFILSMLSKHPTDIVTHAAEKFSVTRTTIHRHLSSLIKEGKIIKTGTTKNSQYFLATSFNRQYVYKIKPGLDEFAIFARDCKEIIDNLPKNFQDIINYSFTEMVNNAIDHSKGKVLTIVTQLNKEQFVFSIKDDGIGVFKNIYDYFHLDDIRESILQLSKGKTTTDPVHHTGEGIFFSSKLSVLFEIYANGYHFVRDNHENDWALSEDPSIKQGSTVVMTFNLNLDTNLVKVFKQFQDEESLSFDRTEIIVELSKFKEEIFISRSQAKRILRNLDKFQRVTLDFKHVRLVGQGFVDEIFRVYQQQHPEIKIDYINANEDVMFMIQRSK